MKIAKEFRWEMGHRLLYHKGKCKNLHGHSYKLLVEFAGQPDENGMIMDYYDVKEIVGPVIERLDHSIMVFDKDKELLNIFNILNSDFVKVNFETTAENICGYLLDKIRACKLPPTITGIKVKVYETETTYAEDEIKL